MYAVQTFHACLEFCDTSDARYEIGTLNRSVTRHGMSSSETSTVNQGHIQKKRMEASFETRIRAVSRCFGNKAGEEIEGRAGKVTSCSCSARATSFALAGSIYVFTGLGMPQNIRPGRNIRGTLCCARLRSEVRRTN